jgi:hypothetical protein
MERSEGDMSLKNPVTPPAIDPGTVRLVAQCFNHYAASGPHLVTGLFETIYPDQKPSVSKEGDSRVNV